MLLIVGMQATFNLPFDPCSNVAQCVRVGNQGLLTLQYSKEKRQLIFTGTKRGETNVLIRDERGDLGLTLEVAVSEFNLPRYEKELRELFRELKNVEVRLTPTHILVDGFVGDPAGITRVQNVLGQEPYSRVAMSLVRLDEAGKKASAEKLQEGLALPGVTVRPFGEGFLLEGTVSSGKEAKNAEELAQKLAKAGTAKKLIVSKLEAGK